MDVRVGGGLVWGSLDSEGLGVQAWGFRDLVGLNRRLNCKVGRFEC